MSGWEPAEVTRYEYDDDGRLVGAVTERDPEWSREDVESLIAYVESLRVGPHGQPMSEATSAAANPSNPDRTIAYDVDAITDFAQQAEDRFVRAFKKQNEGIPLDGIKFVVKKREL